MQRGRENDMELEDFEAEEHASPVSLAGPILSTAVAGGIQGFGFRV